MFKDNLDWLRLSRNRPQLTYQQYGLVKHSPVFL